MITHHNVISNLIQNKAASEQENEANPWERVFGIAPMFHAMGLITMVTTLFRGGGSIILLKGLRLNL